MCLYYSICNEPREVGDLASSSTLVLRDLSRSSHYPGERAKQDQSRRLPSYLSSAEPESLYSKNQKL